MELDVAQQLSCEIGRRGEDAAGNAVPFDAREPTLHLAQRTAVRRRVVHRDVRMRDEPLGHGPGLVRGQGVDDVVDRIPRGADRVTVSSKSMNSALVWRAATFPCTCPVTTSSAA